MTKEEPFMAKQHPTREANPQNTPQQLQFVSSPETISTKKAEEKKQDTTTLGSGDFPE